MYGVSSLCKYFTLCTIHTLHEKIAFSLFRNCIPAKDTSYSNCSFGEVTVKLAIIYEVGVRNL